MKTTTQRFFFSLALLAGLAGSVNAVPTFTVTPSTVSNTYIGPITLQISNVPTGDTVVIQEFGGVVSGALAAGDVLVQQFNLTDGQAGMVIGGVTNFNVPGDLNSTTGAITATLPFPGGDFTEKIIGQYGFVLSSPAGHFTPITNLFTVTNFPFAQQITGNVVSSGTNVPYATVILFPAPQPGNNGPGTPVAGTVANSSGVYSILVPPGTYVPLAFQSNFVGNYLASPVLTLTNTQTINTNLTLTNATASISGTFVDALNPSIVLPGLFEPADNSSGFITSGSSDTNGNFTIRVLSGQWKLSGNPESLALHGYVEYNNGTNVAAGTSGFVGGFYKATSLFYGTVKDNLGNPLPGVAIGANDNNNSIFYNDGYSDANGNYVAGAVGGLGSGDPWVVSVDNSSAFPNYIFSQSALQQNGGTNLAAGVAVLQNFTAILATNQISGNVQFNGTNVVGVGVSVNATINGQNYGAFMDTDTNGNYSLNVANGSWNVSLNCNGGSDSLDTLLGVGNYQCPNSQNVTIVNNNGTANFTVLPNNGSGQIFGYVKDTGNNPITNVTVYANDGVGNNYSTNTVGGGYYSFIVGNGNWGVSVDCGQLNSLGYQCVGTNYVSVSGNSIEQDFIVQSNSLQSLQITTTSLPAGTNGIFYSQSFQASGGTPPYNWFIPNYSVPPLGLGLANNGVLSGTPASDGKFYFDVVVTDSASNSVEEDGLALTILNNPPLPPVVITNASLPGGTVGIAYNTQLGATGGQPPYNWSLAIGSANPPPGLTLSSSGSISGTPTAGGVYYFQVQAADVYLTPTNKVFSIAVASIVPKPTISSAAHPSSSQFQMLLNGVANQNYTLQMSTNLSTSNWVTLYITNDPATNTFLLADPNATNKQRFYRVLVGP